MVKKDTRSNPITRFLVWFDLVFVIRGFVLVNVSIAMDPYN